MMLQKFKNHIHTNFPFLKDKKIVLAISGGLDSVVLLHLCNTIKLNISLAHCNFKLRENESDLDENFIKKISQITSNQIFTKVFKTKDHANKNKISIQIAARELRYNWFKELVKQHKFDYIFTAHHADDNLETFLINLTRSSGLEGFTGIPEINENIIRPLLPFSRKEILAYANENKINWREDATNASTKYIRNNIRHKIVPVLKEINPSLLDSFKNTISNLKASQQIINEFIVEKSKEIIKKENNVLFLNINKIKELSNPKEYLFQYLKNYGFTEWNNVTELLDAQSGKQVFSKTHQLLKDRNHLILSEIATLDKLKKKYLIHKKDSFITDPIQLNFETVSSIENFEKNSIYVNKDLLNYPLIIKKWEKGEYICPIGMRGKKKVSKYFKDVKFSLLQKKNTWLLYNTNGNLIWIIGERQDRRFLAKNTTKNILKITLV